MTLNDETLYADDPDVHIDLPVTDANGGTLEWAAVVKVAGYDDIVGAWQGAATAQADGSTVRDLRIPLTTLDAGVHALRLVIDGDNDVDLGNVYLA